MSFYFVTVLPLLPSLLLVPFLPSASLPILGWSLLLAVVSFLLSNSLIPVVAEFTLKKGLCGKDLCKKGTKTESVDVPEALGLVTGTTYLMAAIFAQLIFALTPQQQVIYNSALFSICFMVFLGFTDDTLDLMWRYKLVLPTIASLPLLSAYSGPTAIYIPVKLQFLFMAGKELTLLGKLLSLFVVVDTEAHGAIIELGYFFLAFMGLLAVFCTNGINIYAGINGLECGQSFVIAASILFFKLFELSSLYCESSSYFGITSLSSECGEWSGRQVSEHQLFVLVMVLPLLGACLSLLKFNWFPARVFVGDTFCYFAGMSFAVLGIHGHFSKTLLLLFLPQILNFLLSLPQLFKFIPCPRHRLPRIDPATGLLGHSSFPCEKSQYRLFKVRRDDLDCPNLTLINLVLRVTGPMHEATLTTTLLVIQLVASIFAFWLRYIVFKN